MRDPGTKGTLMKDLGLSMVAKAANHSIQGRYFPSWEGEAPAEPQKSHSGIADMDRQVAYDRRWAPRCWVGPAYKTFRLGRSLALPTDGFVRVRAVPKWNRDVCVSQSRTEI